MNVMHIRIFLPFLVLTACATPQINRHSEHHFNFTSYSTTDPFLKKAMSDTISMISQSNLFPGKPIPDYYILDINHIYDNTFLSQYGTDTCKIVYLSPNKPTIICNETFLFEIEAVIRSFELPNNFLSSDEAIFNLVRKIKKDPYSYLLEERKFLPEPYSVEEYKKHIIDHLNLIMYFFISHELGHYVQHQNNNKAFGTMLHEDDNLDAKIQESVVKMCAHAEDFNAMDFNLWGFEDVFDIESKIRIAELDLRKADNIRIWYKNNKLFFKQENESDTFAVDAVLNYLNTVEMSDTHRSKYLQHIFVHNAFAVGIYYWYKDLDIFLTKDCPFAKNSHSLMVCMMRDRDTYIRASRLFGEVHRFALLRNFNILDVVIKRRIDMYKKLPHGFKMFYTLEEVESIKDTSDQQEAIWRSQLLQQWCILGNLLDTPFKFSIIGCSTGWLLEIDEKRGTPQALMMEFETINEAVGRCLKEHK